MTMPNGEAGLDQDGWLSHWTVGNNASALATRTQANATDYYRGEVQGSQSWQGASQTFFDVILSGFQTLGGLVDQLVQAITGAANGTLNTLTGFINGLVSDVGTAIGGLADLLNNLLHNTGAVLGAIPQNLVTGLSSALGTLEGFITQAVQGIIGAVRGIPFVGNNIADLLANLTGTMKTYTVDVKTDAVNNQNFTISALAAGQRNPFWVSRNAVADVSFPEFLHMGLFVNANVSNVAAPGALNLTPGNCWGSLIVCTQDTVYDTVSFAAYYTPGSVPKGIYVEVYRRPSAFGGLDFKPVFTSGNVASRVAAFNDPNIRDLFMINLSLGGGLVANAGEQFLIRVVNSGSNAITMAVINQTSPAVDNGSSWGSVTPGATTVITQAQLATANAAIASAWHSCLSVQNLKLSDQSYSDDFNRVNLGPLWFPLSTGTTDPIGITGSKAAYQGTTDGSQSAVYIKRTVGASARVDGDMFELAGEQGLVLSANREGGQFVYLGVTPTGASIYSGGYNTLGVKASVNTTVNDTKDGAPGLTWSLYYTPSTKTYTALKDGVDIGLSWTDSGNTVSHTDNELFGGLRLTRTSGVNSGRIDNWTMRDWAA